MDLADVPSGRSPLVVRTHRLPWPGAAARVVHLTDIHVGPTTPRRHLAHVVSAVRAAAPDVVVLTGDYVNVSLFYLGRVTELVRALPGPCVATLGNHDHLAGGAAIRRALTDAGASVLVNEHIVVGDLTIVGVDDGFSKRDDAAAAFAGVADPTRALVLTHEPNTADVIATYGAPLVLAGHTHGGQVPIVTPAIARLVGMHYLRGFHRIGRTELYVNTGVGHSWFGLRAGATRAEVAVFDLDPTVTVRSSTEA